jgi:hypothetical protein
MDRAAIGKSSTVRQMRQILVDGTKFFIVHPAKLLPWHFDADGMAVEMPPRHGAEATAPVAVR